MAEKVKIGQVRLTNVRLSFEHLFDPQPGKENDDGTRSEPKFNCSFLFPKNDTKNRDAVKAAAERVKKAKWGDNIPKLKPEKVCMRDGDLEDYDGYAGMLYVSASSPLDRRPVLVDRDRTPLSKENGGRAKIYSGCYVNAVIDIWAQDNKHGKRVNASIEAVQFVKHGEAFGAKPVDPNEAFEDLGEGDLDEIGTSPVEDDDDDSLI